MTLSGCTSGPPSTTPTIIYVGCPTVSPCPIPGSQPTTLGELSADIRQLEQTLVACALQVEMIKQCQEQHHDKAPTVTRRAD
ncbi:Rz1-like lysis system protein LysC [Serratia sp. D1N4]